MKTGKDTNPSAGPPKTNERICTAQAPTKRRAKTTVAGCPNEIVLNPEPTRATGASGAGTDCPQYRRPFRL